MTLRCATHEIAVYIPPPALTTLDADAALTHCRNFVADLTGVPPTDLCVFDDRDAVVTVAEDGFFTKATGETPAFDALVAAVARGNLRVLLTSNPTALYAVPKYDEVRRLEDAIQIVPATRTLTRIPDEATLAALRAGAVEYWDPFLSSVVNRRMKAPSGRPSNVLAPKAWIAAFLAVDSVNGWCRIATDVVADALPDLGRQMHAQAVRHFETYLRESAEAAELDDRHGAPEAAVRASLTAALRALEDGRWDDVFTSVRAANAAAPEDQRGGSEPTRLTAAAHLGRGEFDEAFELLAPRVLLDAIFGTPWTPAEPVRFIAGLPELESARRYAAWLCTRAPSMDNAEFVEALDRLQDLLPAGEASALAEARAGAKGASKKAAPKAKAVGKKPVGKKPVGKKPGPKAKPSVKAKSTKKR